MIPVSNISSWVAWSSNGGAWRWIGHFSLAATGPSSSTGRPSTLITRPSVAVPTGIAIGSPVSTASIPRTRPSVGSIATQRTRDSPRCCSTSSVTSIATPVSLPGSLMWRALKIAGS